MKKMVLVFVFTMVSMLAFALVSGDWTVEVDQTGRGIIITEYNGKSTNVTIPSQIEGFPVRVIGEEAFMSSPIVSITIPNTVVEIGENAFASSSLKSIIIPDSVTKLGNWVFFKNYSLKSITLSKNISKIPEGFLQNYSSHGNSSLESIIIPEGVTVIEKDAFAEVGSLKEVVLPKSIREIHESAFNKCTSLVNIVIPQSVTKITFPKPRYNDAFSRCVNLNLTSQSALRRVGYQGSF